MTEQAAEVLVETPQDVAPMVVEENATDIDPASVQSANENATDAVVDAVAASDAAPAVEAAEAKPAEVVISEEEKLWSTVRENPSDFASWVSLIVEIEKSEDISKIRTCYDGFLVEFPLCYGYWKKYADLEGKHGTQEKVVEVYERGVVSVPYSVDMWAHYSNYLIEKAEDDDEIRRLLERGLTYVGSDYLAHLLWDKYLDFELKKEQWTNVAQLYSRILQIPLQQLDQGDAEVSMEETSAPAETPAEPSVEAPADAQAKAPAKGGKTDAEQLAEYLAVREAYYKASKERDGKIREFEVLIKRPYFHVKPLDELQLANWQRYLDFIEKEGDLAKIINLYERCLIPCASYPEYWIRYIQRMELDKELERAAAALYRATAVFLKHRPEIFVFSAKYKEQQQDIEGARADYKTAISLAPGLVEAIIRQANFERRQGGVEAACVLYDGLIEAEQAKEDSKSFPFICMQYARFLDLAVKDTEKARTVYGLGVGKVQSSKTLWQAAIAFEASHGGEGQAERVSSLIEQALAAVKTDGTPALSSSEREELSSLQSEVADLLGSVEGAREAERKHRERFPLRKGVVEAKKRPAQDGGASGYERGSKHHKSQHGGSHYGPGGYANGQAGYGGPGYGGYNQAPYGPPAGQRPPPAQPQAYPAYPPPVDQSGYNYGGYGGYGAAPAAAPPAAYGGYQGYAPQPYVAPAAYSSVPAAAPVAGAQPAYYGQGYYGQ
eukprot:jgi/Mesen1/6890/ME000353S05909